MSSESKVGGLPAKWRAEAEDAATAYDINNQYGAAKRDCADELEAALSAHGQPVVDDHMIERALNSWFGGQPCTLEEMRKEELDFEDRMRIALTAALGPTP